MIDNTDQMIKEAVDISLTSGLIRCGDLIVITAGVPVGVPGMTNLLKVHIVGEVLAQGDRHWQPGGGRQGTDLRKPEEANSRMNTGDILVTISTDRDFIPGMQKAGAIITEEGGLTSHAAVVGINLGIPVVVGVGGATEILHDGGTITVDSMRGLNLQWCHNRSVTLLGCLPSQQAVVRKVKSSCLSVSSVCFLVSEVLIAKQSGPIAIHTVNELVSRAYVFFSRQAGSLMVR